MFASPSQLRSPRCLMTLLCLAVLAGGCGAGAEKRAQTRKVQGLITVDGRPLANGTVQFVPEDLKLPGARGEIQPDGSFSLTTYSDGDGAVIGTHKVLITAYDQSGNATQLTDAYGNPIPNDSPGQQAPKSLVPAEYTNLDSTPLKQTIESSSDKSPQKIDLSLAVE